MKATLTFNLPEDDVDFQMAINGNNSHNVLWEMDQWLRSQLKYHSHEMSEDKYVAYEECREKLHSFLSENNINLDTV